jgi:hypothetical protein
VPGFSILPAQIVRGREAALEWKDKQSSRATLAGTMTEAGVVVRTAPSAILRTGRASAIRLQDSPPDSRLCCMLTLTFLIQQSTPQRRRAEIQAADFFYPGFL